MHFKWLVQCLLMREHESYDVRNVISFPFHITLKFSCASYASGQIRVSSFFCVSRASFFTFSLSSKSTQNYGHGQCPDPQILSLRHKNNLLSRRKDQIKKLKYPVTLNACKVIFHLVLKVLFWQKPFDLEWFCVPAAIKYPFGYKNLHGLTKIQYLYIYIYIIRI